MNIENIVQSYLESHDTIDLDTVVSLAHTQDCDLPRSTVRWHLYGLVQRGTLRRLRRGVYVCGNKQSLQVTVPEFLISLYHEIRTRLPYVKICTWSSEVLQDLMHHYAQRSVRIIEVEKDGESAVTDLLVGLNVPVISYHDYPAVEGIAADQGFVVVKRLISESPVTQTHEVKVPRLEKILVDIVRDKNLFEYLQGAETYHIYETALGRYQVQHDTLLRYASRRGIREEVSTIINSVSGNENPEVNDPGRTATLDGRCQILR